MADIKNKPDKIKNAYKNFLERMAGVNTVVRDIRLVRDEFSTDKKIKELRNKINNI